MNSSELRRSFLHYFERHQHRIVPSSPLVPHGDATLLFTNAGMNQFKDVFLGREQRAYTRATTSQKCMRVSGKHNDLDNVGPSLRHHTFFEMLGNFSFGDYFKHDAIALAWDLLTKEWGLPAESLHATIFKGEDGIPRDDEAYARWLDFLPAERIGELGAADNFWSMGETGPCGRCSEIYVFRGNHLPCPEPVCKGLACDCDRYVEIWNNVFMEFDRQPGGVLAPLPKPSIDTGMGLERIAAVKKGTLSNYDTDVFEPLLKAIDRAHGGATPVTELATAMTPTAISTRVVADHLRAMTFLIADGVLPSNEWRGYVLRKIMRRAMRHGKRLGFAEPVLHSLCDVVIEQMGEAYPELRTGRDTVVQAIRAEEQRFDAVLTAGLPKLEDLLERAAASGTAVPGDEAFKLYDTLGLPLDFIEDLASERRLAIDRVGFDQAMDAQREKARARSAFDGKRAEEPTFSSAGAADALRKSGERFEGYTATSVDGAQIIALLDEGRRQVSALVAGATGFVMLDRTPFYLEAGGQVSDVGDLRNEAGTVLARVTGVVRLGAGLPRAHQVTVIADTLEQGQSVTARVDDSRRDATRRNHTATHLLHAALRQVLGTHVKQAGSLVAPDRLRFDFTHFSPLSAQELAEIESIVNAQILRNAPVGTEVKDTADAMAAGAMALFGEKYGDRVRVVTIPGFSVELCGGTHTRATGEIGLFTVTQEGGVAAGVRRIEALTGQGALADYHTRRNTLRRLVGTLGVADEQAADQVLRLQQESKKLAREVQELKVKLAMGGVGTSQGAHAATDIRGVKVVIRRSDGLGRDELRALSDRTRDEIKSGITFLAGISPEGRVTMVSSITPDLKQRFHAGQIVKEVAPIVGGKGGGRPDFAEAGGPDISKIDELIAAVPSLLEKIAATTK
jgi:alanyl-tRNA synthetase